MRTLAKNHSFITLSILLITGVLIAGWAFAFHYENKAKSADTQKVLKGDSLVAAEKPIELDHNNIIGVLVCVGLIGFFGVRRQNKKLENYVRVKHPESGAPACFLNEINPKGQPCPEC